MTTTRGTGPAKARRETWQRAAVSHALDQVDTFISAQQLHSLLREGGDGVGLATVYRTLQQLADDGEVDVLRTGEAELMYRRCSTGHHHHLVCRGCRRTIEVDSAAVERWARVIAAENHFVEVDHVVEVLGTCAACAGADSGADSGADAGRGD